MATRSSSVGAGRTSAAKSIKSRARTTKKTASGGGGILMSLDLNNNSSSKAIIAKSANKKTKTKNEDDDKSNLSFLNDFVCSPIAADSANKDISSEDGDEEESVRGHSRTTSSKQSNDSDKEKTSSEDDQDEEEKENSREDFQSQLSRCRPDGRSRRPTLRTSSTQKSSKQKGVPQFIISKPDDDDDSHHANNMSAISCWYDQSMSASISSPLPPPKTMQKENAKEQKATKDGPDKSPKSSSSSCCDSNQSSEDVEEEDSVVVKDGDTDEMESNQKLQAKTRGANKKLPLRKKAPIESEADDDDDDDKTSEDEEEEDLSSGQFSSEAEFEDDDEEEDESDEYIPRKKGLHDDDSFITDNSHASDAADDDDDDSSVETSDEDLEIDEGMEEEEPEWARPRPKPVQDDENSNKNNTSTSEREPSLSTPAKDDEESQVEEGMDEEESEVEGPCPTPAQDDDASIKSNITKTERKSDLKTPTKDVNDGVDESPAPSPQSSPSGSPKSPIISPSSRSMSSTADVFVGFDESHSQEGDDVDEVEQGNQAKDAVATNAAGSSPPPLPSSRSISSADDGVFVGFDDDSQSQGEAVDVDEVEPSSEAKDAVATDAASVEEIVQNHPTKEAEVKEQSVGSDSGEKPEEVSVLLENSKTHEATIQETHDDMLDNSTADIHDISTHNGELHDSVQDGTVLEVRPHEINDKQETPPEVAADVFEMDDDDSDGKENENDGKSHPIGDDVDKSDASETDDGKIEDESNDNDDTKTFFNDVAMEKSDVFEVDDDEQVDEKNDNDDKKTLYADDNLDKSLVFSHAPETCDSMPFEVPLVGSPIAMKCESHETETCDSVPFEVQLVGSPIPMKCESPKPKVAFSRCVVNQISTPTSDSKHSTASCGSTSKDSISVSGPTQTNNDTFDEDMFLPNQPSLMLNESKAAIGLTSPLASKAGTAAQPQEARPQTGSEELDEAATWDDAVPTVGTCGSSSLESNGMNDQPSATERAQSPISCYDLPNECPTLPKESFDDPEFNFIDELPGESFSKTLRSACSVTKPLHSSAKAKDCTGETNSALIVSKEEENDQDLCEESLHSSSESDQSCSDDDDETEVEDDETEVEYEAEVSLYQEELSPCHSDDVVAVVQEDDDDSESVLAAVVLDDESVGSEPISVSLDISQTSDDDEEEEEKSESNHVVASPSEKVSGTRDLPRVASETIEQGENESKSNLETSKSPPVFPTGSFHSKTIAIDKSSRPSPSLLDGSTTPKGHVIPQSTKQGSEHQSGQAMKEVVSKQLRRDSRVKRGNWTLGSRIGRGSFGSVHMCMMTDTGTILAAKEIQADKMVVKDIRREIELLRKLDHPNIVAYRGTDTRNSNLYIFQEWVPGGSVTSMLNKFGPFSLAVIRVYLMQVTIGLAYLHEQGILHRDIKGM